MKSSGTGLIGQSSSWAKAMRTDSKGNPMLDQHRDDEFVDLTFRITNLVNDGKCYRFHLSASRKRRIVGMDVVMVKGIKSGFNAGMNLVKKHVYRGGVRFLRSGVESDLLVAAISELYGSKRVPKGMVAEESFTAIALHEGKLDFKTDCVKLKLFGRDTEPFDENAYYESFFNVDLADGFVYWNEKDPAYRKPLLRALSAK